jgi:GntR family transcriptional regulator
VLPFRLDLDNRLPLAGQIVYAVKKAIVSGQLEPGDPFPSVRALSQELRINPNTAHKAVASLVVDGLLEVRAGIGTVVAALAPGGAHDREALLGPEVEKLVVEAVRLHVGVDDVVEAVRRHWRTLCNREGRR